MPYPCPIFLYEFEELKMTSMQETKAELTLDHFGNDPITRVENALSGSSYLMTKAAKTKPT